MGGGTSWERSEEAVRQSLERLEGVVASLQAEVVALKIEIAAMQTANKVHSMIWSAIGAAIPVLVSLLIYLVVHGR